MRRRSHPYMQQPASNFGNLTYTETVPDFYGAPVEDYQRVSAELYHRGEQNRLAFEELSLVAELDMQNIRQEFKDGADGQAILGSINKVHDQINTFVEGGNFHNANKALSKTYRQFLTDEDRQAALAARQKQVENMQAIQESDLPQQYKEKAMAIANSSAFNKSIADGGYIGWNPAEYVDINDLIKKYMGDWNSYKDSMSQGMWQTSNQAGQDIIGLNPYLQKITESTTGISEEKVIAGITGLVASDPKAMAWLESQYMMDNFDIANGQMRQITESDLVNHFAPPRKDSKGVEIDRRTQIERSMLAIEGAVAERREVYEQLDISKSDQEILQEIHKEHYMKNQIMSYVGGQGIKFAHSQRSIDQGLMQDYIFKARQDAARKAHEDMFANVTHFAAQNLDLDPVGIREQIQAHDLTIRDLRQSLEGLDRDSRDYKEIEAQIKSIESAQNNGRVLLHNLYRSISDPELSRSVASVLDKENFTQEDRDRVTGLIKEGKFDEVENFLEGSTRMGGISTSAGYYVRRDKTSEHGTYSQLLKRLDRSIDPSKTEWHKNMLSIDTEGTLSARIVNEFENMIMYRPETSFTTIDGRSFDKKFREEVEDAKSVKVSYLSSMGDGNLIAAVSWLDETGRDIKTAMVNTNQIPGAGIDLGWELLEISQLPKYYGTQAGRNNEATGKNIVMSYTPVFKNGINLGNFATYMDGLSVQTYSPNETIIPVDDPIVFKRDIPGTNQEIQIPIAMTKGTRGRIHLKYQDAEGNWVDSGLLPFDNVGSIYNFLFNTIYQ